MSNEAGNEPSEVQQEINESEYFGITEDFEGWYINGSNTYIWKLNFSHTRKEINAFREESYKYDDLQAKFEAGMITRKQYDIASDEFGEKIFKFGLQNFTDEDLRNIYEDAAISRQDYADCARGLFYFLTVITTKRSAMRSVRPHPGAPNTSNIN